MKLNQVLEVEIIDDNHNGNGIFKVEGFPVFVHGTVTGDIIKVKIIEINKKYAIGKAISFLKKSVEAVKVLLQFLHKKRCLSNKRIVL